MQSHATSYTFHTQLKCKMSKQNQFLYPKAKEIIFNVSETFEKEESPGSKSSKKPSDQDLRCFQKQIYTVPA